jgi:uridine kinase
MEKKNLTIIVGGQTASGKSRLTYLLKKFLRENGIAKIEADKHFNKINNNDEQKI